MKDETVNRFLSKVPEITLLFWLTKVLTTGMGEVFSDYLFFNKFATKETVLMAGAAVLGITLILQLCVKRYIPWVYWLNVVAVSIFGTMFADFIHEGLQLDFTESTMLFLLFQAMVFAFWYAVEKTLSIKTVDTFRREAFYWATVLGTFALGTAAGDWTAISLEMGAFSSGVMFTILIIIPALGYRFFKWNEVFSFWFAYVMTRPLGASFSDWMAHDLKWGTGPVSLVLSVIIILLVLYLTHRQTASREQIANLSTDTLAKR